MGFLFSFTLISQIQRDLLYWNYIITILSAVIPMIIVFLFKRNFKSYGFQFKNAKSDIIWALIFVILIILPSILTILCGVATYDIARYQLQYFISTLIFQLIITGVFEEIYFRGYIQSRLNKDFNHPYISKNIKFGPGVTIAALLFGLAHVFNPFYLIIGNFQFNIFSGIFAAQVGMLLGLIREKTDSLLIPILIHGLYNGFVSFFSGLPDLFQTFTIGFGFLVAWIFLFTIFIKKYKMKESNIKELNIENI